MLCVKVSRPLWASLRMGQIVWSGSQFGWKCDGQRLASSTKAAADMALVSEKLPETSHKFEDWVQAFVQKNNLQPKTAAMIFWKRRRGLY